MLSKSSLPQSIGLGPHLKGTYSTHIHRNISILTLLQDETTVRDLATDEKSSDMTGRLQRVRAWLFEGDIFASVASDDALLRIHATAEEFEGAAEECFVPLQVCPCCQCDCIS